MQITLRPEDQNKLEALVASGRYASLEEALHVAIEEIVEDDNWGDYASERIEAGWADMEAGRTKSWEEVKAWLDTTTQKRA